MMRLLSVPFLAVAVVGVLAGNVHAAPQILGLIAYNDALELTCDRGACSVELTTMCLQKHRDNPPAGTAYRFHGDKPATLIVTGIDGAKRTFVAEDYVSVTAARGFTSVRVEITERQMRDWGAVHAELDVSRRLSLVPLAVADDLNPITDAELDYAMATLRTEADRWLASSDTVPVAARVVNRMINITPRRGRMTAAGRSGLWSATVAAGDQGEPQAGRRRAEEIYDVCRYSVEDVGNYFNMRRCLQSKHDELMQDINREYWQAVRPTG